MQGITIGLDIVLSTERAAECSLPANALHAEHHQCSLCTAAVAQQSSAGSAGFSMQHPTVWDCTGAAASTLSSADTVEAPTLPVPPRTRTRFPSLRSRRCARSSAAVDETLPFCCCAAAAVISWLPCRRQPRRHQGLSSCEGRSRPLGWGRAAGSGQDASGRVTRELL